MKRGCALTKQEVVKAILASRPVVSSGAGRAFAPANIALCKYWGKRDEELNLPMTSSLSVSLDGLGTTTEICLRGDVDRLYLHDRELAPDSEFARRTSSYLDLFRPESSAGFEVRTRGDIPVAAGLASSASGFAALILALDQLFGWALDGVSLSILARLGSGSACRSVFDGFVEWHAGTRTDGMDSHAEPLNVHWPEFRIALLTLSDREKPVGSRPAMRQTKRTSTLYTAWPVQAAADLRDIRAAISDQDFERLGRVSESNALAMHATMLGARPPVLYWLPETVETLQRIWALRGAGAAIYATMDAGPNVKLLFEAKHEAAVRDEFPEARVVTPFERAEEA